MGIYARDEQSKIQHFHSANHLRIKETQIMKTKETNPKKEKENTKK